jgi:aminoglycoside phosphotransferase family enzyme/predicted kinase
MKQSCCPIWSPAVGLHPLHTVPEIRRDARDPMRRTEVPPDPQRDVVSFLSTPQAYRLRAGPVERIDTHISIVWLAGDRAFKLKRAVCFDYVDFSTVALRRVACEAEVRLNRRTAPALYRGVQAVTREADGSLALGGAGVAIDWVVEMTRFDQDTLFDRLAERGRLEVALMEGLAEAIVRFHADATVRSDHGGRAGMAWVVDGNALGCVEQGAGVLEPAACARLTADTRAAIDRHATRLDARRQGGLVRECHGDLHLRNICLLDGVPTIFDGVEFNDEISCIDVLYDLAFLLMDLWRRDLRVHANTVFNEYIARTTDVEALCLLPLFLSCRAAVRAKTSATAAKAQRDTGQQRELQAASRQYLELARRFLLVPRASLIAIGGFSGSGKSTLAHGLAPAIGAAPGALVVRSDVLRKTLLGVAPLTRLGPEGYAADVTHRVYRLIAQRALTALKAGHTVIADAVFARHQDRETIAAVAREAGVPFAGLWIDAPPEILARRVADRVVDASDATVDVLESQIRSGTGPLDWRRLDGSADAETVLRQARSVAT